MNNIVVSSNEAADDTVVHLNEPPRMWMYRRDHPASTFLWRGTPSTVNVHNLAKIGFTPWMFADNDCKVADSATA